MARLLRDRKTGEVLVAFAAGTAVLGATLTNFLTHNQYPVFRPEVGIIVTALLLLCAGMAFFHRAQRQWGRSFLEGLLAALFVDLNTDSMLLVVAVAAGVFAFTLWRRTSLTGPMAVMGSVIMVTTLLGLGGRSPWIKSAAATQTAISAKGGEQPAIIHLIVDEHIGIEGLAAGDEKARRLRDELKAFYLGSGFVLYGGAYSEHLHTVNAIPHMLNYGTRLGTGTTTKGVEVGPTDHLEGLVRRGYRLTIFQSDFADFCSEARFSECLTYDSSSLRPTLDVPLSTTDRARLIWLKLLTLSNLVRTGTLSWMMLTNTISSSGWAVPRPDPENDSRSSTVGTLAAVDQLAERLRKTRPGDAYFAHLLLPHYPYVVRADCSFLPLKDWRRRRGHWSLTERQSAYYDQVRCTMRKIEALLRAVDASPAGQNAVVIIHGDHGSRITRTDPNEPNEGSFDDDDMIAGFSTLFALRTAGLKPQYLAHRYPAYDLLRTSTGDKFQSVITQRPRSEHGVFLDDWAWKPKKRVQLPPSWVNGPALGPL